jgi:hypothetical protein
MPRTLSTVSGTISSSPSRPAKPRLMPRTSQPRVRADSTAARMTALRPGASPPPVEIAIRMFLKMTWVLGCEHKCTLGEERASDCPLPRRESCVEDAGCAAPPPAPRPPPAAGRQLHRPPSPDEINAHAANRFHYPRTAHRAFAAQRTVAHHAGQRRPAARGGGSGNRDARCDGTLCARARSCAVVGGAHRRAHRHARSAAHRACGGGYAGHHAHGSARRPSRGHARFHGLCAVGPRGGRGQSAIRSRNRTPARSPAGSPARSCARSCAPCRSPRPT